MEVLENNKSKMTERVTLASLLQFIIDNTQRYQPKEEIVEEEKPKANIKPIIKTKNKIKSFEETLLESSSPIKFSKFNLNHIYIIKYSDSTFLNTMLFFFSSFSITSEMITSGHKRFIQYGGFTDFGYSKLKWNKKTLLKSIDDNSIDEYYLRSLSDYLHINIFILNSDSKLLTLLSDYYPYRKHFVMYKLNNQYYPIFNKETLYFNAQSDLIQKLKPEILTEKTEKVEPIDIYGQLKLPEFLPEIKIDDALIPQADLQSVVNGFDDYDSDEYDSDEDDSDEDDEDVKDVDVNSKSKIDYSKLSYKELQDLAKKRGIPIKVNGKLLTKDKLMQQL
jgi:hypothetical protein